MKVEPELHPSDLFEAIARNQLRVEYQPLVEMANGRCVRFEALCRWTHPTRGEVSPFEFIPLAESTQSITPLTLVVLRQVAAMLANGRQHRPSMQVTVNVSPATLRWEGFFPAVEDILAKHNIPFTALGLEITESTLMGDLTAVLPVLQKFRANGVRFDLDDFGTGYSSLGRLANIELDAVKIDKQFLSDTLGDPRRETVVRTTIDLAHDLGLEAVAEGVEDRPTWDYLRALNCDVAQGYLIARPMNESRVEQWLASWEADTTLIDRPPVRVSPMTAQSQQRRQVLVAEDDLALLELMRGILENAGCDVLVARNGAEALALLERHRPALALIDAHLPVIDGRGVLSAIKKQDSAARTIVMSAGPLAERVASELGASGYLAKPFGLNALLGAV